MAVERFNGTVLDEFFRIKMRETFYESVTAFQVDLDTWLRHYNTTTPTASISDIETRVGGPSKPLTCSKPRRLSGQPIGPTGPDDLSAVSQCSNDEATGPKGDRRIIIPDWIRSGSTR